MTLSFYPVHEKRKAAARARATKTLSPAQRAILNSADLGIPNPESGLTIKNINELLDTGKKVRYPDLPFVSYPDMLANEFNNHNLSPFTADGAPFWNASNKPKIAVVGAGMSGLLTAWQLSKLGAIVDLWEASPAPNGDEAAPQGAGRIRPVNVNPNDKNTRAEFGAMRFPDTSYLFWHYLRLMMPGATTFTEFPNPGKVPTYFSGEGTVSGYWGNGGNALYEGPDNGLNYSELQNRHINAFVNVSVQVGNRELNLGQVSGIMLEGNASAVDLEDVKTFWSKLSDKYYTTTYESFIKQPEFGFSDAEIDVIGYMGLGTGGFAPLFPVSVLDVMRLIVWNYAAEYAVPDLYRYPYELYNTVSRLLKSNGGELHYNMSVESMHYHRDTGYGLACKSTLNGSPENRTTYSHVVLAMTHKAAFNLLTRPTLPLGSDFVQPYSNIGKDISTPAPGSLFRNDIQHQTGMSSVKIFQTMGGPEALHISGEFSSVRPVSNVPYEQFLRVVFGKTDIDPLGVTYMLPYPKLPFSHCDLVVGLQYSWGVDSINLRDGLLAKYINVNSALESTGIYMGHNVDQGTIVSGIYNALSSRIGSKTQTSGVVYGTSHVDFFLPYRTGGGDKSREGYFAIIDWDRVPNINMGFKLDAPGIGLRSINHFKLAATTPITSLFPNHWDIGDALDRSVKNIYFCGDSFSYYGGWVEGAFQSALNATAGIVYAAATTPELKSRLSISAKALVEQARHPSV